MGVNAKRKPVVGIIANVHVVENRFPAQMVGERNLRAVADVIGALPLMFAGTPEITDIGALLDTVDGVLLTGARANVHPTRFGLEEHPKHEPYDHHRDALALALVEACVERRVPIFGICRGFQEMSVAFGSTLHPEIRELPGLMIHRMPRLENGEVHLDPNVVFADRHEVRLAPDGVFAQVLGRDCIRVNSLHGQGILEPGGRIVVEGIARVKKHVKPNRRNAQGGILSKEAAIDASNVLLFCPTCRRRTRMGRRYAADGHKIRYCKKCSNAFPGKALSKPRLAYSRLT